MKALHLLYSGGIGGTEVLCKDIAQFSSWDNTFCFLSDGGIIADEMEANGTKVFRLYERTKGFINQHCELVKLCKAENYDAVFIQHFGFFMDIHFNLLKDRVPSVKGVKILHLVYEPEHFFRGKLPYIKKQAMVRMFNKCDLILGVSEAGKKSFQDAFKIPAEKMAVVYNGIGIQMLEAGANSHTFYEGTLKLLYVGRLAAVKGVDLVIKAMAELRDRKIDFTIVGDGPAREGWEKLTCELNLGNVHFEGFQRNVYQYYKKANAFIYPSTWNEVFGISIVEAMSFGLPCVANRRGGIPEIVDNKKNGYITVTSDVEGVRKALICLIDDYDTGYIEKISYNARSTAERFSIVNTVKQLEDVCSCLE